MKPRLLKVFEKGQKLMFLGLDKPVFTTDGLELYTELERGEIYTVKEVYMISVKLEEFDGIYLKEHFRKI